MNEITVQFFGICTHMEPLTVVQSGAPRADWGHRVVLVNASSRERIDSHPELKEHGVQPHVADFQIAARDLAGEIPSAPWFPRTLTSPDYVTWRLEGVLITIRHAVGTDAQERGECIPHLSNYVPDQHLPQAGPTAYNRDPKDAACYFDFPRSAYFGRTMNPRNGGAAVGVLLVHASGAAGEPVLIDVERFTGGEKLTIPVRPGAQISLANVPTPGEVDTDSDFLLHYLVCRDFPQGAKFPAAAPCAKLLDTYNVPLRFDALTGPGCSNSNYP